MRVPIPVFVAGAVAAVGLAGMVRGAIPQSAAGGGDSSASSQPIVITGAYVRQPASPDVAAAYFTVNNTTSTDDTLTTVTTGAGQESSLHTDNGNGGMSVSPSGLRIPAHSSVTLSPGKGHVMIEKLYGTLKPGQTVNLELDFANAGPVVVTAPVIAVNAPAPTTGATK